MKIGILAGEISGDKLAANLLRNFILTNKKIKFSGIVGPELKNIGCEEIYSINELCIFGLIEPILKLTKILQIRKKILNILKKDIEIFIGIDFPEFNLNIEKILKYNRIFVIHIVSPSIWAWRKNRIYKIKKSINVMIILFNFEKRFYTDNKIPVKYIGHPSTDLINTKFKKQNIKFLFNLKENKIIISLLPGSRLSEIKNHIFIYNNIIDKFKKYNKFIFIILISNDEQYAYIKNATNNSTKIFKNNFYNFLKISNIVISVSGTAVLESILCKKRTIVVYKMNRFLFNFIRKFVKVKYISMPNIISSKKICEEFIQEKFNTKNITNIIKKNNNNIINTKKIYFADNINNLLNINSRLSFNIFLKNFIL